MLIGGINIVFAAVLGRAHHIGFSATLVFMVFMFFGTLVLRFLKRAYNMIKRKYTNEHDVKRRVMIVGGGDAGLTLIKEMISSEKSRNKPVCILDDDEHLIGKNIYDVRVVGTTFEAKEMAQKYKVEEIFVAMPSVDNKARSEIIKRCGECGRQKGADNRNGGCCGTRYGCRFFKTRRQAGC
jgi:FlaA1/EpsC-like NDP-sugar epimerase